MAICFCEELREEQGPARVSVNELRSGTVVRRHMKAKLPRQGHALPVQRCETTAQFDGIGQPRAAKMLELDKKEIDRRWHSLQFTPCIRLRDQIRHEAVKLAHAGEFAV